MARENIIDGGESVIVGAGLAGLFTALKLAPMPVTVLASAPLGDGASSAWAQGGIATAMEEGDSPASHAADTVAAGAGIVDPQIARILANEARDRIEDMLRIGVPFDRDLEGRLTVGREAAHSHRRILHVNGDRAGFAIMQALIAAVRATPSIRVLEGLAAFELIVEEGRVGGVMVRPAGSAAAAFPLIVKARRVVLASGGSGQLFALTTNPSEARGEGIAIAARAGAVIADPEFVQFHPTAMAVGKDPAPLATEALRGEGAILLNGRGERFMLSAHEDAELAPRDIVARAIAKEVRAGRGAFLDTRPALGDSILTAFPTVAEHCKAAGIDPTREAIPVAPAEHYHMGGVSTDAHGRTSLAGLWAVGEVASTGAHGANRLASNSLLEAVVFGARVANDIAGEVAPETPFKASEEVDWPAGAVGAPPVLARLRDLMTETAGVERNRTGLVAALQELARLEPILRPSSLFLNMLTTAKLILTGALQREESRGGHFRSDFPQADAAWAHRTFMTLREADEIAAKVADGFARPKTEERP